MTNHTPLDQLAAFQKVHFFDEAAPRDSTWSLLSATYDAIEQSRAYYDTERVMGLTRLWWWRMGFLFVRILAVVAIVVAVLAPAIGISGEVVLGIDESNAATVAYVAILVAGLLLFADQTFVFSKNWVRYRKMDIMLWDIRDDFLDQCRESFGALAPEKYTTEHYALAVALCSEYGDKVRLEKTKDVETWASNISDAITAMQQRVDNKSKTAKERFKAAMEARTEQEKAVEDAAQSASLLVKFTDPGGFTDARVALRMTDEDGTEAELRTQALSAGMRSLPFLMLKGGNYAVTLSGKRKAGEGTSEPFEETQIVKLDPGGHMDVAFD